MVGPRHYLLRKLPCSPVLAEVSQINVNRAVVVGVVVGSDSFVECHTLDDLCEEGAKRLAQLLTHMPGKQTTVLFRN